MLAVDQTVAEKDGQKVIVGKTATIQVDPLQAKELAKARQLGQISLALRSLLDSQSITSDDSDGADEEQPPPADGSIDVVRYGVTTHYSVTPR